MVVLLGVAAGGWRLGLLDAWLVEEPPDPLTEPAAVAPPAGLQLPPVSAPSPVAAAAQVDPLRVAAVRRVLAPRLGDPDLGRSVHAAVAALEGSGAAGYSLGEGSFTPASTMKLLTATAALAELGRDHRFATTVIGRGRTLTLVGGGDPVLLRRPDAERHSERADVVTLARRTAAALRERKGRPRPMRLRYDASLFSGPAASPAWRSDYVPDDIVSPITALWVDEGLTEDRAERVDDPAAVAAQTFAAALRREGVAVQGEPAPAPAPEGATELARVESPPLAQVVEQLLEASDNEGAEVLAHHVGLAVTGEGSFAGGLEGVRQVLDRLGVPLAGTRIRDGSGLSRKSRLTTDALVGVLRVAADPAYPDLRPVLTGLPVGGFTGSLAFRFDQAPEAGVGRVRAKTGSLTGVRTLAGIALDATGTPLVFVLAADRIRYADTLDAQTDLDNAAAALGACRCSR